MILFIIIVERVPVCRPPVNGMDFHYLIYLFLLHSFYNVCRIFSCNLYYNDKNTEMNIYQFTELILNYPIFVMKLLQMSKFLYKVNHESDKKFKIKILLKLFT